MLQRFMRFTIKVTMCITKGILCLYVDYNVYYKVTIFVIKLIMRIIKGILYIM